MSKEQTVSDERLATIYAYPGKVYDLELRLLIDEVRAARALPSPSPAGGMQAVTVKPLEWGHEYSERLDRSGYLSIDARSIVGSYGLFRLDADSRWVAEFDSRDGLGSFDTADEAKAAAQSDYEQRILSALSSQAQTTGGVE